MSHNNFLKNKFDSNNCSFLPDDIRQNIGRDFDIMSSIGVENEDDLNRFFLLKMHVPFICRDVFNKEINDKTVPFIIREILSNRDTKPVNTLLGLIEAIDLALKKMLPQKESQLKLAYPQPDMILPFPQYNISKWVDATHSIYNLIHQGYSSANAKQSIIGQWEPSEQKDYENWLRFYKEKVPEKYQKLAASEEIFMAGLPASALKSRIPNPISHDAYSPKYPPGMPEDEIAHADDSNEVRETIEKQRSKLIGRLNSAEKLLSSMDGQMFAGDEQELMLKLLQDLKRRIQTANKRTVKSSLFEDHIYRTANILRLEGKNEAAGFFYKIAQLPDLGLDIPPAGDSATSAPEPPPTPSANPDETKECLREFFEALKEKKADDEIEFVRVASDLIKTAQGVPEFKTAPSKEEIIEVEEKDAPPEDNTDDLIEAALRNVTIHDVIHRLEMLVSVYNQRELSRQLAILDIMMDRINMASLFPEIGESMSKALDANQYIGTRLGNVLTQLKASMKSPETEKWTEVDRTINPETAAIRGRIEKQRAEEDERKAAKKTFDAGKAIAEKKPIADSAELQQPSRIERAPKIEVR